MNINKRKDSGNIHHNINKQNKSLSPRELHKIIPNPDELKKLPSKIRNYYSKQQYIIESFHHVDEIINKMSESHLICSRQKKTTNAKKNFKFSIQKNKIAPCNSPTGLRSPKLSPSPSTSTTTMSDKNVTAVTTTTTKYPPSSACSCCCCRQCRCKIGKFMRSRKGQILLTQITFAFNFFLLVVKLISAIMTLSLLVMSSVFDSCFDLVSSVVLWWTARAMERCDRHVYPLGRSRLEPIAVVILAVIISVHSCQIIIEASKEIASMAYTGHGHLFMPDIVIGLTALTIVIKILLFAVCKYFATTLSVETLVEDHTNDIIYNTVVIILSTLSSRIKLPYMKFLDPIGAILVSMYIIFKWYRIGKEHVRSLTGHIASPAFYQKICYLVLSHNPAIVALDTVLAVYFGQNFMIEVHVVLPEKMSLAESHNIGTALQRKLEALPEVEIASVHIDFEMKCNYDHTLKLKTMDLV